MFTDATLPVSSGEMTFVTFPKAKEAERVGLWHSFVDYVERKERRNSDNS